MILISNPCRSYKYLKNESLALWPFGYGLSYTNFSLSSAEVPDQVDLASVQRTNALNASITVRNTGSVAGDEVVFLFQNATAAAGARSPSPDPQAKRQLIGFERVSLQPGESKTVTFSVSAENLSTVDRHGTRHVLGGRHSLIFSRGHGDTVEKFLTVNIPLTSRPNQDSNRLVVSTMAGFSKETGV